MSETSIRWQWRISGLPSATRDLDFWEKTFLGSGFDFDVKVSRAAELCLRGIDSPHVLRLKGQAGEPRAKFIHTGHQWPLGPADQLNNVETWANVPLIINKGADWYSQIGTEGSKAQKSFSLVGQGEHTGLVEVPMGMKLREIRL